MNSSSLLHLLHLSDLTLPIGGFSHSAGLETYVQLGKVKDKASAQAFVAGQLAQNLFYTDAAFLSLAYDAAMGSNVDRVLQLDEECTAVKLPKELRQASQKLGLRLLKIFLPLCSHAVVDAYKAAIQERRATGHYSIVFGVYAVALDIAKEDALKAFFYNAAAGMVTNCVKLVPLGQMEGQEILFSLHPQIDSLAGKAMIPDEEEMGRCCPGFDIRCMQHEQLYSRLYMS